MSTLPFIIDCPWCKAKVAAIEGGRVERTNFDAENGEPFGARLLVGTCPSCDSLLAGEARQIGFEGWQGDTEGPLERRSTHFPEAPKDVQ